MDVNKLKTFYYVALEGSYKKASIYLDAKIPYISKHITALENAVKCKLFKRSHRSLILTEKGQELLEHVQILIHQMEKIEKITSFDNKEDDIIRIVTTTGVTSFWLIKKLQAFQKLYPRYKLRIITVEEKIDVSTHYADVAILPKIDSNPDIIQKKLFTFHMKLFASRGYLEKFGTPKTISDLDNHRLISFYHNEMGYRGDVDWHLRRGIKDGATRVPYLVINSTVGGYMAAMFDMGIISFAEELPNMLEAVSVPDIQTSNEGLVNVFPHEGIEVPIYFSTHHLKMKLDKVLALSNFFKNESSF